MMMQQEMGLHLVWMLVMAIVVVLPFWRICAKAGYSGWLGLLILFPVVNLVFLYYLAFSEWPTHRKFR